MADEWYYACGDQRLGPVSGQRLQELAEAGQIQAMDFIWKGSTEKGVLAHRVKNLFAPPPAEGFPTDEVAPPKDKAEPPPSSQNGAAVAERGGAEPEADPGLKPLGKGEEASAWEPSKAASSTTPEEANAEAAPQAPPPAKPNAKPKGRIVSAKGAVIVSQNGTTAQFQKKCTQCGYLDTSKSTLPIRSGITRATFFCRKCRKLRQVEIQGIA